jgi:phosphopantetheinyl transferase
MPLYKLKNTGTESAWGIWKVEESAEELAFTAFEEAPEGIIHITKRLEWLASRVLVRTLLEQNDLPYSGIHKDEFGKPFLRELTHHISLSHAYPYVAVQLDSNKSVGIDIEQPTEKLYELLHECFRWRSWKMQDLIFENIASTGAPKKPCTKCMENVASILQINY